MREYIITITCAAVLSSFALMLSPEKWRAIVRIAAGLMVISCIISPAAKIFRGLSLSAFSDGIEAIGAGEDLQSTIFISELEKRISADIEERLKNEYNLSVQAACSVKINGEGAVEGVKNIRITGDKLTEAARLRLCEVYGINPKEVRYE